MYTFKTLISSTHTFSLTKDITFIIVVENYEIKRI